MLTNIKKFADDSETLKESCINVKDTSLIKEIEIYIVFMVMMGCLMIFNELFLKMGGSGFLGALLFLFSFIITPILVYLFVTKIEKRSWGSIGVSKGNAVSQTLKGLLIGFAMFLAVVIIGFLLGQFRFDGFDLSQAIYILSFLIGFSIQSFSEEIYTRGWTLNYIDSSCILCKKMKF